VGLLLAWRGGVSTSLDGGALTVSRSDVRVELRGVGSATAGVFRRLTHPGADEAELADEVGQGGAAELSRWFYYLDRLTRRGLVGWSAHEAGVPLATLVAVSPSFGVKPLNPARGRAYLLSRFAYFHREGNQGVVESPLAHARVVLHEARALALVGVLVAPTTAEELAARSGIGVEAACGVLTVLLRAGMLVEDGTEEDPDLRTWAFHDLLFHARSRKGRSDAAYGGTYRFASEFPPPSARKPIPAAEAVGLFRPDLEQLMRDDPPLARVQEQRRSGREFDTARPITVKQLAEFLFRVNRVKDAREAEFATVRGPVAMDFASRPYPAGGGLYELELYAVVNACEGLAPGLYYHDPFGHQLVCVRGRVPAVEELLGDAAESTGVPARELQVVLVLAARVPRVAWKYESIAYALVLKHVGVVYQTMYLAATAMGLAACGVGGGDADLFARAAGVPYATETSVGEFLLGSPRRTPDRPADRIAHQ
jgi:SagB-type dehydrogenase family enzyme